MAEALSRRWMPCGGHVGCDVGQGQTIAAGGDHVGSKSEFLEQGCGLGGGPGVAGRPTQARTRVFSGTGSSAVSPCTKRMDDRATFWSTSHTQFEHVAVRSGGDFDDALSVSTSRTMAPFRRNVATPTAGKAMTWTMSSLLLSRGA